MFIESCEYFRVCLIRSLEEILLDFYFLKRKFCWRATVGENHADFECVCSY